MDIEGIFERFSNEFLHFERIEHKLHRRPDLHAFLLLDALVPGDTDMVAGAQYDEIYLDVEPEKLAEVATENDIRDLVRCGMRLDDDVLCMFT